MAEAIPAAPATAAPATPAAPAVDPKAPAATPAAVEVAKRKIKLGGQDMEVPESEIYDLVKTLKHRTKVDGKEVEVDYDQLIKDAQLGRGAQKRMMDADVTRRQAEELIKLAKTDPRKLLSHPSVNADIRAFAEQVLSEQIAEQMMDPKDREIRDAKKKLSDYEANAKQQQFNQVKQAYQSVASQLGDAAAKTAVQILQDSKQAITPQSIYSTAQEFVKAQSALTTQIDAAVTTSGLPNTSDARKRVAAYMHMGAQQGIQVPPEKAAALVREDYLAEVKHLFGSVPNEKLLELLGDELGNKVVKSHLERQKKPSTPVRVDPADKAPRIAKKDEPRKRVTRDEWLANLDKRVGK